MLATPSVTTEPPTVQIVPALAALAVELWVSSTRLPIIPTGRDGVGGDRVVAYRSIVLKLRLGKGPNGSALSNGFSDRSTRAFGLAKSNVSFVGVAVLLGINRSGV